jgi:predicted secreted Zn-dependent protease
MIEKYFTEGLRVNTDPVGAKLRLSIQPKLAKKYHAQQYKLKTFYFLH